MAYNKHVEVLPFQAASAIGQWAPVKALAAPSARDGYVTAAATLGDDILGFTIATVASAGNDIGIVVLGVTKGVAAASLGHGARVAVGTTTGRLIPVVASNIASSAAGTGARYQAGKAMTAAADGQIFSVLLLPEQIV